MTLGLETAIAERLVDQVLALGADTAEALVTAEATGRGVLAQGILPSAEHGKRTIAELRIRVGSAEAISSREGPLTCAEEQSWLRRLVNGAGRLTGSPGPYPARVYGLNIDALRLADPDGFAPLDAPAMQELQAVVAPVLALPALAHAQALYQATHATTAHVASTGLNLCYTQTLYTFHVSGVLQDRQNSTRRPANVMAGAWSRERRKLDAASASDLLCTATEWQESRAPAWPQQVDTVMAPAPAAQLLSMFGRLFGADIARNGLGRHLGRTIALPRLTLIDDSRLPGGLRTRPYDGEGTPSQRTLLIDRGVLCGLLHTRATAVAMGTEPNGKARRPSLTQKLFSPRATNLYIAAGDDAPADLVASLRRGLWLTRSSGPAKAMPGGGRVLLTGSGWWVENGQPVHPVAGVQVMVSLQHFFSRLRGVGHDLAFPLAGEGTGSPTLLLEGLNVEAAP